MFKETAGIQIQIDEDMFNSDHFGIKMGNMEIHETEDSKHFTVDEYYAILNDVMEQAVKEGFQHLTCKIDPNYKTSIYALQKHQFLLVDTLVTACYDFSREHTGERKMTCEVGDCREEDIARLKEIAKISYKMDRFHSDPSLANDLCDQYYEKWIENCCHGFVDKVIVGYVNGQAAGYATCKWKTGDPYIEFVLAAVDPEVRGLGVHNTMKYAEIAWATELAQKNPNIKGILDGTQLGNIAVQRTWSKVGFIPYSSRYVFQKRL